MMTTNIVCILETNVRGSTTDTGRIDYRFLPENGLSRYYDYYNFYLYTMCIHAAIYLGPTDYRRVYRPSMARVSTAGCSEIL